MQKWVAPGPDTYGLVRCLDYTVKPRPSRAMHLRQRGQDFVLPNIKYKFNKRHFIARLQHFLIMFKCIAFVLCVFVCSVAGLPSVL